MRVVRAGVLNTAVPELMDRDKRQLQERAASRIAQSDRRFRESASHKLVVLK